MPATNASEILDGSIAKLKAQLRGYEQPSEVLAFETLRALDHVYCDELFTDVVDPLDRQESMIMSWGVNHALSRILPLGQQDGPFCNFRSSEKTQRPTNDFLFSCGTLSMAERLAGMLRDGLVRASIRPVKREHAASTDFTNILVVTGEDPALYSEVIGQKGLRWLSAMASSNDRCWESDLERRHLDVLPELGRRVRDLHGWSMSYTSTRQIDAYFLEWGQLYLRRMVGQDTIALEELMGGRSFNEYLGVLAVLTGRAQKHLCYTSLLKHRLPHLSLRNLLTAFTPVDDLVKWIAGQVDADTQTIRHLLEHLTLRPENVAHHTSGGDIAWAPVVQASEKFLILPMYGLEINPFLFLLNELRRRYEKDWFRAANNREQRWIAELRKLFVPSRWHTNGRNLKLGDGKRVLTDIDFAVWDAVNNELGIFQLKWQQPIGLDNRARRSAGSNLMANGNRWTETVSAWLNAHSALDLAKRLGFRAQRAPAVRLFVIARYHAYFSGFGCHDGRAVWTDWSHFLKIRMEDPDISLSRLATLLESTIATERPSADDEKYMLPLPELAIVLNPKAVPAD
jgi:hypothetical protein